MSFLFDKLFQKQNPELASQMSQRGLIFDKNRHRWVKKPASMEKPTTAHQKTGPSQLDEQHPMYDVENLAEKAKSVSELPDVDLEPFKNYEDRQKAIKEAKSSGNKYMGLSSTEIDTRWKKIKKNLNKWDKPKAGKENMANSNWIWEESPKPRRLSLSDTLVLSSLHKEFWTGKSAWEGMDLGLPGVKEEVADAQWRAGKGYEDEEVYNPDESGEDWSRKIRGSTSANFQRRLMHSSLLSRKIGDPQLAWKFEKLQAYSLSHPTRDGMSIDKKIAELEDQLYPKVKERLRGWRGYSAFYDDYSGHP